MNKTGKYKRILLICILIFLTILVLFFAYKIVSERLEKSKNQTSELKNLIEEQQASLSEQRVNIEELQARIEKQNILFQENKNSEEISATPVQNNPASISQDNSAKYHQCNIDINKYCTSDSFREKSKLDKMLDNYKENFGDSDYQKYKKKYTEKFNDCQEALACK